MKLYIHPEDNKIYTDKKINITCFTEYGLQYQKINVYPVESKICHKQIDSILLIPFTHINNIWHLMHQLFILYKYIKKNNIKVDYFYFVFFDGFYHRQGNIFESTYLELICKGIGLDTTKFKELHTLFETNECIEVQNIRVVNESITFNYEPLLQEFKKHIFSSFEIKPTHKNITFLLRRGSREITNTDIIKKELSDTVNYVYIEDYSVREQLEIVANTKIFIGVHGAGLTWSIFMKNNSLLIELYPGKSNTDNYIRWCKIAGIKYKRMSVNITKGNQNNFRNATVNLSMKQINDIKKILLHEQT